MNTEENLNAYKGAYETKFKFYDENQWYLNEYSAQMAKTIRHEALKSILSLGIGHQVVSNKIISLLDEKILSHYEIVEGSAEIIDNFRNNCEHENISVHEAYFENFQTDIKFDAIEMGFVLEHVDDPLLILQRFKSLLKDSGVLFVAVPNARSLHRLIGNKAGLLEDLYSLSEHDFELGHKRYFDLNSICELVELAGYNIVKKHGLMLKPITGDQISKLNWGSNIIEALMGIGIDYPEISNCIYIEARIK